MPRIFLVFGCLCFFWSAQAEASTYRYEFDVIDSRIGFFDEYKYDFSSPCAAYCADQIPWLPGERENYIRAYHPLGYMYGMTGHVVMDVTGPWIGIPPEGSVNCVSVFCLLFRWDLGEWGMSISHGGEASLFWFGGHGNHIFSCHSSDYLACQIEFWLETASFTIANFSRTELTTVPLPATAPVLAAGVLILGAVRMQRRAQRV